MHARKKFAGGSGTLVFGRDKSCGVRFAEDAKGISSLHCEIRKQGDHYVLIDKNSSYGTFLKDGKRLELASLMYCRTVWNFTLHLRKMRIRRA